MKSPPMRVGFVLLAILVALALWLVPRRAGAEEPRNIQAQTAKIETKAQRLDANGDGWLDDEETAKGQDKLGILFGAVRNRVDANGDGRVAVTEYTQAQVRALHEADANGDGWLDESEAKAHKRKLIGELLGGLGGNG